MKCDKVRLRKKRNGGEMRKERVLIVEDEMDLLDLVDFNLTRAGFVTEGALDGEAAIKKLASFAPDLVVLDLMLPKVDGWELCRWIKAKKSEVPVIMLTAKTTPEDRQRGLECGAEDYVTKPFNVKELVKKVESLLEVKRGKDLQSMLVHEVTNRLGAIGAYSNLLLKKDETLGGEAKTDFLKSIKEDVDSAAELVSQIGAMTKLERGARNMELKECDIGESVRRVAESLRGAAEKRGLTMQVEVDWALPEVLANGFALRHIFANLIGNAVKYNRPNGSVAVSVKRDINGVLVSVRDSGIGIPAESLPHLFRKGYRADNAVSAARGTGLGLYIVKTLAERLGASVSYGSVEGEGSSFAVYFRTGQNSACNKPADAQCRNRDITCAS